MADIPLTGPKGEPVYVDEAQVPAALKQGYSQLTPEQNQEYQTKQANEEKYGGVGGTLAATALGAGESLTGPGANYAATKLGITTPEEIKTIEEMHPVARGVGMVGGVLGAPEFGLAGAANLAEKGVAGVAEALLPEATSTAGKIISNVATRAAGGATQGAAFTAGDIANDKFLGDPDLNAEKMWSRLGTGALWGGTIGGAIQGAEEILPRSYGAVKNATNKLYEKGIGAPGEEPGVLVKGYAKAASNVSDTPYQDIIDAWKNRTEAPPDPIKFTKNLQDVHNELKNLSQDISGNVKYQDAEGLLKDLNPEMARNEWVDTSQKLKQATKDFELNGYPRKYINEINNINDRLVNAISDDSTAGDYYKAIDNAKREIGPLSGFEKGSFPNATEKFAAKDVQGLYHDLRASLENPDAWGEAAARQSAINSVTTDLIGAQKDLIKEFGIKGKMNPLKMQSYLKQLGSLRGDLKSDVLANFVDKTNKYLKTAQDTYRNLPDKEFNAGKYEDLIKKTNDIAEQSSHVDLQEQSSPGSIMKDMLIIKGAEMAGIPGVGAAIAAAREGFNALKYPLVQLGRLESIEGIVKKSSEIMENLAGRIFKPGVKMIQQAKNPMAAYSYDKKQKEFSKIQDNLAAYSNDTNTYIDHIHNSTKEMYSSAPNITTGMQATMGRATEFLKSKMPSTTPYGPLSPEVQPSDAELSKFFRYVSVVNNPMIALKQIKDGTLLPETMEALQAVTPKLLTEMQNQVYDKLTDRVKNGASVPYKTKLMLSMFLGKDMVSGLNQQNMSANYMAMMSMSSQKDNMDQAQAMAQPKGNKSGMAKLSIADRSQTDMQATIDRGDA